MTDLDHFGDALAGLEQGMGSSAAMVAAFEAELARFRDSVTWTGREVGSLSQGFSGGLRRAFEAVSLDGLRLGDALKTVARALADTVYATALRPVAGAMGGAMAQGVTALMSGLLPFAQGGGFSQGRVMPFAKGGLVSGPMHFAMRGGTGLMGEAGPEAIMPLSRGPDGKLGVQAAAGGRPVQVVMHISTPDVQGFRRSESQIAAQIGRALARGQRNR